MKASQGPVAKPVAAPETPGTPSDWYASRGIRVYQIVEPKVPGGKSAAATPQTVADAAGELKPASNRDDEARGE